MTGALRRGHDRLALAELRLDVCVAGVLPEPAGSVAVQGGAAAAALICVREARGCPQAGRRAARRAQERRAHANLRGAAGAREPMPVVASYFR